MKLLFLLDAVYSGESANIRLAKMLARKLSDAGHETALLVNAFPEQQPLFAGFDARFFTTTADKCTYETLRLAREAGKGTAGQMLALAANPAGALNLASTLIRKRSLAEKPWRQQIEKACAEEAFDAVVSVSCPHYSMLALGDADIPAKKICYMLDPYWSNQSVCGVSLARETALYEKIDAAFITDLMLAENKACSLAKYENKMRVLAFPGLAEKTNGGTADDISLAGQHRLLYVGNLYPGIRSPEALLQLMEKLPESFGLTIVGGGREGFPAGYFEAWQQRLGSRLALHAPVSAQTASDLLFRGDVLVNIGNTVANQLPSKIFEYLSTGKPVLNLTRIANCPSLPYFEKYPLGLSAFEPQAGEQAEKIAAFCLENAGKTLPYREVEALYPECTADAVARRFSSFAQAVCAAD